MAAILDAIMDSQNAQKCQLGIIQVLQYQHIP